jgi:predicted SAM-dependent methyltransferase
MVRPPIHALNRPLATLRCRVAARRVARPVALEVGGLTRRDGWFLVNVNATTPHYMDGTKRWIFEDGSLSHVYADNMIEHVPLAGGRRFFAEALRCLRPGGILRLVTPDVRHHVELYLRGVDVHHDALAEEYRKLGVTLEHPIDMLRTPIGEFGHHSGYVYDFETLEDELLRAGFSKVQRMEMGESNDPKLRGLEQRPEHGPLQLVVEATR